MHESATAELITLAQGMDRWALPVFCAAEFMRVVTHGRVFSAPSTLAQTAAFEADAHGNLMFDSQIVALCREHGIDTVLTNDRDFELFEALHVRRLD